MESSPTVLASVETTNTEVLEEQQATEEEETAIHQHTDADCEDSDGNDCEDDDEEEYPSVPQPHDVLLGATDAAWPGNALFDKLIQRRVSALPETKSAVLASEIIRIVTTSYGGRFFSCESYGTWTVIEDEGKLLEKVGNALIDAKYCIKETLEDAPKRSLSQYLHALYMVPEFTTTPFVMPPPLFGGRGPSHQLQENQPPDGKKRPSNTSSGKRKASSTKSIESKKTKKKAKPAPPKSSKASGAEKSKDDKAPKYKITKKAIESKTKTTALHKALGLNLPKGVTVRPSGKWQAQIYFAGQSRYIGVFDTAQEAAVAFVAANAVLSEYRKTTGIRSDKAVSVFAEARRAAAKAVRDAFGLNNSVERALLNAAANGDGTLP